jgi:hypothetical protein
MIRKHYKTKNNAIITVNNITTSTGINSDGVVREKNRKGKNNKKVKNRRQQQQQRRQHHHYHKQYYNTTYPKYGNNDNDDGDDDDDDDDDCDEYTTRSLERLLSPLEDGESIVLKGIQTGGCINMTGKKVIHKNKTACDYNFKGIQNQSETTLSSPSLSCCNRTKNGIKIKVKRNNNCGNSNSNNNCKGIYQETWRNKSFITLTKDACRGEYCYFYQLDEQEICFSGSRNKKVCCANHKKNDQDNQNNNNSSSSGGVGGVGGSGNNNNKDNESLQQYGKQNCQCECKCNCHSRNCKHFYDNNDDDDNNSCGCDDDDDDDDDKECNQKTPWYRTIGVATLLGENTIEINETNGIRGVIVLKQQQHDDMKNNNDSNNDNNKYCSGVEIQLKRDRLLSCDALTSSASATTTTTKRAFYNFALLEFSSIPERNKVIFNCYMNSGDDDDCK